MAKKATILFLTILLFLTLLVPNSSASEAGYVLQTGDLSISAWHMHYSRHTFSVANPGFAEILISKVTPDTDINGGFLFLNRRLIPLRHFLRGEDLTFEKKVKLRSNNRLNVFFYGTPGAAISIVIRMEDAPAPPPTITFSVEPLSITIGDTAELV
jgi:hypothetical protein